jgi:SulP family sulfate permease
VGVVLSALLFMNRMAGIAPEIQRSVDSDVLENYDHINPGIGIYEISGPFFFASAKSYCEVMISSGQKYKVLIVRMRHVPFIDATGVKNFREAIKTVQKQGTKIVLSGVNRRVYDDLEKSQIVLTVGQANVLPEFSLALEQANHVLEEMQATGAA